MEIKNNNIWHELGEKYEETLSKEAVQELNDLGKEIFEKDLHPRILRTEDFNKIVDRKQSIEIICNSVNFYSAEIGTLKLMLWVIAIFMSSIFIGTTAYIYTNQLSILFLGLLMPNSVIIAGIITFLALISCQTIGITKNIPDVNKMWVSMLYTSINGLLMVAGVYFLVGESINEYRYIIAYMATATMACYLLGIFFGRYISYILPLSFLQKCTDISYHQDWGKKENSDVIIDILHNPKYIFRLDITKNSPPEMSNEHLQMDAHQSTIYMMLDRNKIPARDLIMRKRGSSIETITYEDIPLYVIYSKNKQFVHIINVTHPRFDETKIEQIAI